MSLRRIVIDYKTEGKQPDIQFEGMWNRKTLDMMYLAVSRAWRMKKMEMLREANIARTKQEEKETREQAKKDGRRKAEEMAKEITEKDPISDYLKEGKK